jgi:hypothetical protein
MPCSLSRFELDTAIETNTATLNYLLPNEADLAALTEVEKRRFKLHSGLSAMHCKALRRLYGTQGSQVIELLLKCPAAAVSQVTTRLPASRGPGWPNPVLVVARPYFGGGPALFRWWPGPISVVARPYFGGGPSL